MSGADLEQRLARISSVLARSADPLHAPFAVEYRELDGESYLRQWEAAPPRAAGAAVLYVHIPFCARVCSYCLLSASNAPGKAQLEAYVAALRRQIALFAPVARNLSFSSLHIGGGTPTLLGEQQLDELLADLSVFSRADGFQIGVEAHPATASAGKLGVLQRHGVDRVSFGVETFTPAVLRAVNRADQTAERVASAVAAAKQCELAVNLDLLAGLPGEDEASFAETVRLALALEPDSMSVNRFLAENSPLAGDGYRPSDADARRADRMLLDADRIIRERRPPRWPDRPLGVPGYGTQYVWHRDEKARPYFQQDMIGPSSTLAFGQGGMGHLFGRFYSITAGTFTDYIAALAAGRPPAMLVSAVTARFEAAFFVADRVCRDSLSLEDFASLFRVDLRHAFGRELDFLLARGLLAVSNGRLHKPLNRRFQVTHLLAFLALEDDAIERALAGVDAGTPPAPVLQQYDLIEEELPPTLLWCRMAIRASQAMRRSAAR